MCVNGVCQAEQLNCVMMALNVPKTVATGIGCVHEPKLESCDDENSCTLDICDGEAGCVMSPGGL